MGASTSKEDKRKKKPIPIYKNEDIPLTLEINKEKIEEEIIEDEQIKKIILDENLPKPTKWCINGNEPLKYLSQSDHLGLNDDIKNIFWIGEKFYDDNHHFGLNNDIKNIFWIDEKFHDDNHHFYLYNEKGLDILKNIIDQDKNDKIRKINDIKKEIFKKYDGFKSIKEENDNSLDKITENYIEKIKIEKDKIKIESLYEEYLKKYRNIIMENYEKLIYNKNININPKKFNIYYSSYPEDKNIKYFNDHPVLFGFYKAWVNHCPITITPNMIWQLILNVFIKYVDLNSESLREKFVNFEGKKTLKVFQIIKDEVNLIPNKEEWEKIIDNLIIKIGENTGKNILDEFILDFSTNDKNLLFVQKVSLMSMFKKYFEYKAVLGITCGYPYINIEGTIKDWKLIKKKLNDFKKYGLVDWIYSIDQIINEILNTKKGNINYDFWKNILFEHFGEEMEAYKPIIKYIKFSGWLTKFFYFNNKGEEIAGKVIIKYNEFYSFGEQDAPLSEFSITPLTVAFPNNKERRLKILSGIIGASQDPNTLCVKPELGFFILDENWGKE